MYKSLNEKYFLLNSIYIGSHCINPTSPPDDSKLKITNFNAQNPPSHGQHISYMCDAGGWNRYEHDFFEDNFAVECLPQNTFETINSWPKCVAGMFDIQM